MIWIAFGIIGLAAVLLFLGAFKLKRLEERMEDDDGVTLLEDEDE